MSATVDFVGVVPAAGAARRIAPLPCSKEVYPVGFQRDPESGELRAKVVSSHLLDKFRAAGVRDAFIVIRSGKWDIPAYFREGNGSGINLAYIVIDDSLGPPDTVDRAYPFIENRPIAFGFPDIVSGPDDLFVQLIDRQRTTAADLVLGLFPSPDCRLADMIDIDDDGRVRDVVLKPPTSALRYTWTSAVWTPPFTRYLHAFVAAERAQTRSEEHTSELQSQQEISYAVFCLKKKKKT